MEELNLEQLEEVTGGSSLILDKCAGKAKRYEISGKLFKPRLIEAGGHSGYANCICCGKHISSNQPLYMLSTSKCICPECAERNNIFEQLK